MWKKIPSRFHAVDMHNHLWTGPQPGLADPAAVERLLHAADLLGIERIGISNPITAETVTAEEIKLANDVTLDAMNQSRRFFGFVFVDPRDPETAVAEIDRCAKLGMAGVKLYHQLLVCDEAQRPVMEAAAQWGIPVLMHAGLVTDPDTISRQPRLSHAGHFLKALDMFPDTTLIQAHIGGGGDWEWNLRVLDGIKSDRYFIDLGGSVCDANIVRRTIDAVGASRVLFATDMSMEEGVAKLDAAKLDEPELEKILSGNWRRIEARRKSSAKEQAQ
ncbi:MAG: amidohydrolase family protein [Victivallaceae bacterium]